MSGNIGLMNQLMSCQIATFGKLRTACWISAVVGSMVGLDAMFIQRFLSCELLLALCTFKEQIFVECAEMAILFVAGQRH